MAIIYINKGRQCEFEIADIMSTISTMWVPSVSITQWDQCWQAMGLMWECCWFSSSKPQALISKGGNLAIEMQ